MSIYYIDRKTGEKKKEIVAGEGFLKWIYESTFGYTLLELLIKKKLFSFLYGKLQDTRISSRKIKKFIKDLEIDMNEAKIPSEDYKTFNDFFARVLTPEARPITLDNNTLISPADGRILAYQNIDIDSIIQVKGSYFNLLSLLNDTTLANEYRNGTFIIVRLCPSDYHRFHFPDSGLPSEPQKISGHYYSVNPLALRKVTEVYCQNKREITVFDSNNFGNMILLEVGATCVGSIIQTYVSNQPVTKGDEKGYFKFGGSTVIMLLKENTVRIDKDILENSREGIETKVNMGERIGYKR